MLREIRKEAGTTMDDRITALAHPDVVSFLYDEERFAIEEIEKGLHKKIVLKADNSFHLEQFDIHSH
jgi:Ribonuclease G/E